MSNFWTVAKPTAHMKNFCKELGPEYRITSLDLERIIYRDLGNGYDVEISRVNTTSQRKKACIYLWKNKNHIIKIIENVPQSDISSWVGKLHALTLSLTDDDFGDDGYLHEDRTESAS